MSFNFVEALLSRVSFDQYGTPDRKLPDCPCCEEDELFAGATHFYCYRCNWKSKCLPSE